MIVFRSADLATLESRARAAQPEEACGLLEGRAVGDARQVTRLHPSENLADDPAARFEVDPRLLLRLQKELRGRRTELVGIYHSHPTGPARPSATDLAMAWQPELVWVITALAPQPQTHAFRLRKDGYDEIPVVTRP